MKNNPAALFFLLALLIAPISALAGKADIEIRHDIAYGRDPANRFDAFIPRRAKKAPVLFMIHGGAWRIGDKSNRVVVNNKMKRWTARGFVFISVNYRLLPANGPLIQAQDIARALAAAQKMAPSWGGDPDRFIIMGHSSGGHLAALLSSDPAMAFRHGARKWLGTVLIDSAALDARQVMTAPHLRLYDRAFGYDPDYWIAASPWHRLRSATVPLLAICSSLRKKACPQAHHFATKARGLGSRIKVLPVPMSHRALNRDMGLENAYTREVEKFLASLDKSIARLLGRR